MILGGASQVTKCPVRDHMQLATLCDSPDSNWQLSRYRLMLTLSEQRQFFCLSDPCPGSAFTFLFACAPGGGKLKSRGPPSSVSP